MVYVCLFSIEIQIAGWIRMKFGTDVVLEGGEVRPNTPHPRGTGCAFWQELYKTKVAGHPQLSDGRSPYRTPNLDLEGPRPSLFLEPWSLTIKGSL